MTISGDSDPSRPKDTAIDGIATQIQRTAAVATKTAASDLNAQPPAVQYDNQHNRYYDTAPVPLKRLFGSPLVQTGPYATGKNRERRVGDGWGAPRNFSYDKGVNTNSFHQGLDFQAPMSETILACGDGIVSFAGYQGKEGGVEIDGARQGPNGVILDGKGNVVAVQAQVGFGGICVHIKHKDDFQNYRTEYYHMSAITVQEGKPVSEGQPIGAIGNSGVAGIGPHLHFQIAYCVGKSHAVVNPTGMVPNYRPGFADSSNSFGGAGIIMPQGVPNGVQIAAGQAANMINGQNRGTTLANQKLEDLKQRMAQTQAVIAKIFGIHQTQLYLASAGFAGKPPIVVSPMTFDFDKGVWMVGTKESGPV